MGGPSAWTLVLTLHPSQRLPSCHRDAACTLLPSALRSSGHWKAAGGSCFRDISRVAGPPPGEEGRGTSCEAEAGPGPPRSGLALAQEPWFGAWSWCSVIILVAGRGHVWELTASVLSQSRVFRPHSCPRGGNFGVSAVNDVSPGSPGHSPASSETEGTWSAAQSHLGRAPTPAAHRS